MLLLRDQLQATLGDGYALDRELAGASMSRMFLVRELALGRTIVVKVLPPDMMEQVSVERFRREIQLAAGLQHPHIVPVHSAGETNGLPYYTMPYVEGESLRERLEAGPLSVDEATGLLREIAKALAYAHDRGIVHRDIKPENVLLVDGTAMVTDFGIAKALSSSRIAGAASRPLTRAGVSMGTPAYMSPEQAAAEEVDHRADIYAFGCMAYELFAGEPPFVEKLTHRVLAAHIRKPPMPVADRRPDIPPAVAALVMRCLAKNPDDRPQHASEIVRALTLSYY